MATFTEDTVRVEIVLTRSVNVVPAVDRVFATATSIDSATGQEVRHIERFDITDQMSAARMTGIASLLDDVIARVKQRWGIA